jgi:hypothetical protein
VVIVSGSQSAPFLTKGGGAYGGGGGRCDKDAKLAGWVWVLG